MKLTAGLILFTVITVTAGTTYSQTARLNLKMRNASLVDIFREIERTSNFGFFFKDEEINLAKRQNINLSGATIDEILHKVLNGNYSYRILDRNIVITRLQSSSQPQGKRITGKVTDKEGKPLLGVSVVVRGTTNGVMTDEEGGFSIANVPANATLLISFVGMKSLNVSVAGKNRIAVSLEEENIGLNEVVAIGYGTVKKQNITGSVSAIKSDALKDRNIQSLGEGLAGQLAGVQAQQSSGRPGAELDIRIRGLGTINASNAPLYVLDGIPLGSSIKDLNPNDVASIEVLKDAASCAIYGARGSSGVVLITTKQGKRGKTPTFDFTANYGIQKVDKIIDMMNSTEYAAYNIWNKSETYLRAGGSLSTAVTSRPSAYQYPDSYLTPSSLVNTNWQKEIYRTAPMQSYQLSASGGSDIGTYLISGSYMKQDGIEMETDYQRANFRMNTTLNVGDFLKFGMNIAPSFSKENNPDSEGKESALHHAINMSPTVPTNMNTQEWGWTPSASAWTNPAEEMREVHDETLYNKVLTDVWGELAILKNLKLKSQYGYNFAESRYSYFKPLNVNGGQASYGLSTVSDNYAWSLQNTLNYTAKISSLVDVNLLLGQSMEGVHSYNSSLQASGYPNDLIYTTNVASTPQTAYSAEAKTALSSYFGRADFNILDKYLLSVNMRRDGSSNFGTNTKWGNFPSASLGWKINKEEFLKDVNWLDLLKFRASIGKTGNNSIGNYSSISLLSVTNYNLNGTVVSGLSPYTSANPDLGWETKVSKDIGIDASFFKNRIQTNLDFYIENTKDMLLNVPVSYMTGYSSMTENLGKVQNKGVEFEVTTHNLEGNFNWSTSFNISKNINKVKALGEDNAPIISYGYGKTAYITEVGHAIGSYYMYKTNGILTAADIAKGTPKAAGQEEGNLKIVDVTKDGKIDANDMTIVGSNQPDFTWGITNRFAYKGFDLSVLVQGSQGGSVFLLGARHYDTGSSGVGQFARWVRCYKVSDAASTYATSVAKTDISWDGSTPNPFGNNMPYNDTWIYDATFIRIKSLTFGYTIPMNLCQKIHCKGARIYFQGDNLFTWNNYPGATPETNTYYGNDATRPGTDYATYPLARKYSFGINLTF